MTTSNMTSLVRTRANIRDYDDGEDYYDPAEEYEDYAEYADQLGPQPSQIDHRRASITS